jgi:hypothetical protein
MLIEFDASAIIRFHDQKCADTAWPRGREAAVAGGLWHWVETDHQFNTLCWREEDKTRRTDVAAGDIATGKRLIDQYKQARDDAIEALDECLLTELGRTSFPFGARLHSETAGAMIDRLSVLALKIYHMQLQTKRRGARAEHIALCRNKLERLVLQRNELGGCLDSLLQDTAAGRAYFKVYRHFQMANDPALNPQLYARGTSTKRGRD